MGMKREKKLPTWAREQDVDDQTAGVWMHNGIVPVPVERTPGGLIRVIEDDLSTAKAIPTALCVPVSSSAQKADLTRQPDRLPTFAAGNGDEQVEMVAEIGSGCGG